MPNLPHDGGTEPLAEALARISRSLLGNGAGNSLADLSAECERLAAAEKERRRRSRALDALLPTLAEALDVREVFQKVCGGGPRGRSLP